MLRWKKEVSMPRGRLKVLSFQPGKDLNEDVPKKKRAVDFM